MSKGIAKPSLFGYLWRELNWDSSSYIFLFCRIFACCFWKKSKTRHGVLCMLFCSNFIKRFPLRSLFTMVFLRCRSRWWWRKCNLSPGLIDRTMLYKLWQQTWGHITILTLFTPSHESPIQGQWGALPWKSETENQKLRYPKKFSPSALVSFFEKNHFGEKCCGYLKIIHNFGWKWAS